MDKLWIVQAPLLRFDTPIREMLPALEKEDSAALYLLTDQRERLAGCVRVESLLRFFQFGAELDLSAWDLREQKSLIVRDEPDALLASLGRGQPILVAGRDGRPLGVLDETAFLLERLEAKEGSSLAGVRSAQRERELRERCRALEAKAASLEEIIEHTYDEINVTDENGVCIMVNSSCERLFGLRKEEMVGRRQEDIFRTGTISSYMADQVIQQKRQMTDIQYTQVGKRLLATANPIFDGEGNVRRVVISSRELSEFGTLPRETPVSPQKTPDSLERRTESYLQAKGMVAQAPATREAVQLVQRVAGTDSSVLLLGETGTGKSAFAELIHALSSRSQAAMVKVNCAAIPESLVESEFFGYSKGAFTGAQAAGKAGLFQVADQGTLFLDEVAELSLPTQSKLLRAIQDGEFFPVGSSTPVKTDCRIIAATSQDLRAQVEKGVFREDLYYRLCVFPIQVPPLRERAEDIPYLMQRIIARINRSSGKSTRLHQTVMEQLKSYSWPGNIRELENVVERILIISDSELITLKSLSSILPGQRTETPPLLSALPGTKPLKDAMEEYERALLHKAMETCRTTYDLARLLQVNQSTVVRKMARYGLTF